MIPIDAVCGRGPPGYIRTGALPTGYMEQWAYPGEGATVLLTLTLTGGLVYLSLHVHVPWRAEVGWKKKMETREAQAD